MAVFTPVVIDDLSTWIKQFPVGRVLKLEGITSGIENSNFFLTTEAGEYVLTIFENLRFEQLPFYLHLMRHLAEQGVLVPVPVANQRGEIIHQLHGKPASIVTKLEGACEMAPGPVHCAAVGEMLARMHLAARNFTIRQPNLRGLAWWRETTPLVLPHLPEPTRELLEQELDFQTQLSQSDTYRALPQGPIHADLFRNNVMFDGQRLTGFFDFYFAGCDTWLFDLAVTVNDWCIDADTGALDDERVRALVDAYAAERIFTKAERAMWQPMLRAAALRFWLSRLFDYYQPRDAQMLVAHDPMHFQRILQQRQLQQGPSLVA